MFIYQKRGRSGAASGAGKGLTNSGSRGMIEADKDSKEGYNVFVKYTLHGSLNSEYLSEEFGGLQTNEIIITNERFEHIKERHNEDVHLFEEYAAIAVTTPDVGIKDTEHNVTVFMVKKIPETNLNVVVRLALNTDKQGLKNSVMTFYRIREKT